MRVVKNVTRVSLSFVCFPDFKNMKADMYSHLLGIWQYSGMLCVLSQPGQRDLDKQTHLDRLTDWRTRGDGLEQLNQANRGQD